MSLELFQKQTGLKFHNEALLKEALTHRSYINENPEWEVPHNERLEFLGDAVLELVVTDHLFRMLPDQPEGRLTSVRAALVNYQNLARVGREMGMEEGLMMSKGEARDTGRAREVILANAFEAVVGAYYLDAGYEAVEKFLTTYVLKNVKEIVENNLDRDAKSLFQEIVQERFRVTPNYEVLEESGPDHDKLFKVGVFLNSKQVAEGEGHSKQEAETQAAQRGLNVFKTS